jgi:hypothetical protein
MGADAVLSKRDLNRSLLARQMLLEREPMPVAKAVDHLVGLQAQVPLSPYVALWSRIEGFDPAELSSLIERREAVRMGTLRGTIFLHGSEDALRLRPVVQPVLDRTWRSSSFARALDGLDLEAVRAEGRQLVADRPLTWNELGRALSDRFPGRDPLSLAYALRHGEPMVQTPPRGLWDGSGAARHTTADVWLGRPLETGYSLEELVMRYLRVFGPASWQDVRTWCGLQLREVLDSLRPRLRTFRDEHGRELFDVEDGLLPDPDMPAPVRFLPELDNVLLSHADRSRIVDAASRKQLVATVNNLVPGSILVDGFVGGSWKVKVDRQRATLHIRLFASMREQCAIEAEGWRLLRFLQPDRAQDVQTSVTQSPD